MTTLALPSKGPVSIYFGSHTLGGKEFLEILRTIGDRAQPVIDVQGPKMSLWPICWHEDMQGQAGKSGVLPQLQSWGISCIYRPSQRSHPWSPNVQLK